MSGLARAEITRRIARGSKLVSLACPICQSRATYVIGVAHRVDGTTRRRRQCVAGHRFNATERVA